MAEIDRIEARLVADASQFVAGMDRAAGAVGRLDPRIQRLSGSVTQLGLRAAGFAAPGASMSRILTNIALDVGTLGAPLAALVATIGVAAIAFRRAAAEAVEFDRALDGVHKRARTVSEALAEIKGAPVSNRALQDLKLAQGVLEDRLRAVAVAEQRVAEMQATQPVGGAAGPAQALARAISGEAVTGSGQALDFARRLEQAQAVLSENNRLVLEADAAVNRAREALAAYNVEQDKDNQKRAEAIAQRQREIAQWDEHIRRLQKMVELQRMNRELAGAGGRLTAAAAGGIGIRTDALTEALVPQDEAAASAAAHAASTVTEPLSEQINRQLALAGQAAASALVTGLITGFDNMGDILKSFLSAFIQATIIGPLFSGLQIFSPSKLTAGMGRQLGMGFVVGMQATQRAVESAALEMAPVGALATGASRGVQQLGDLSLRASLDVSGVMGAPVNPFAAARDAEWQRLFRESSLVARSQGFK